MPADSSFSAVPSPSDGSSSAAQPTAGQSSAARQSAQQRGVLRPPASALLLLAVLVATFGLLRWTANPAPHSGGDNAAYVALGHALATGQGYVESWDPSLAPHTKYPPVWPSALAAAQRLGADSWQALKGVTTLFALLAAAATWLFAVARVGPWAATGAALATVTSFSFLDHASWLLSDVPSCGRHYKASISLQLKCTSEMRASSHPRLWPRQLQQRCQVRIGAHRLAWVLKPRSLKRSRKSRR